MSGIKGVMKGGWHPEGKGGPGTKESWREDNKGINQVVSLIIAEHTQNPKTRTAVEGY